MLFSTLGADLTLKVWLYMDGLVFLVLLRVLSMILYQKNDPRVLRRSASYFFIMVLVLPLLLVVLPQVLLWIVAQRTLSGVLLSALNTGYSVTAIFLLFVAYGFRKRWAFSVAYLLCLARCLQVSALLTLMAQLVLVLLPYALLSEWRRELSNGQLWGVVSLTLKHCVIREMPILCLMIISNGVRQWLKKKQFDETLPVNDTTGQFGSAAWATPAELHALKAYDPESGPLIGRDAQGRALYLPLLNKLTISPPGGGKTTASSIPVLLSHDGPVFVFDIKGELWAVTARYRQEHFKRKVVVIDPYQVTQLPDFKHGKSESLLARATINPFDWIPEDLHCRDRIINAFAASFIIQEGGYATHFDENAKILIRGYIDYIMHLAPAERHLATLYALMSESVKAAGLTFDLMEKQGGRARAAAQQIKRVGMDERGSILSTSYRQIDWIGDSNMQATLSVSNVDLREFIQGNLDIFVVLPEDQVKEHSRLVRMLLALLMGLFVQASPSELPKKKSLFLLEELAQLGYCPDVEQCIEVLRARGVVIWSVFQSLSQIELFEKPDLFKGAALKQIFTNDDTETMQWIQTLGGKKTILTKTRNAHTGHSQPNTRLLGGSSSSGEGESIHETGTDFIQLNAIREMPSDEQMVFLHGAKPILCKKVRYFEHPAFEGKFDPNPLEIKNDTVM